MLILKILHGLRTYVPKHYKTMKQLCNTSLHMQTHKVYSPTDKITIENRSHLDEISKEIFKSTERIIDLKSDETNLK